MSVVKSHHRVRMALLLYLLDKASIEETSKRLLSESEMHGAPIGYLVSSVLRGDHHENFVRAMEAGSRSLWSACELLQDPLKIFALSVYVRFAMVEGRRIEAFLNFYTSKKITTMDQMINVMLSWFNENPMSPVLLPYRTHGLGDGLVQRKWTKAIRTGTVLQQSQQTPGFVHTTRSAARPRNRGRSQETLVQ